MMWYIPFFIIRSCSIAPQVVEIFHIPSNRRNYLTKKKTDKSGFSLFFQCEHFLPHMGYTFFPLFSFLWCDILIEMGIIILYCGKNNKKKPPFKIVSFKIGYFVSIHRGREGIFILDFGPTCYLKPSFIK